MAETEQFDWSDKKSVVVKRVDAIAVYRNSDDVVIRQQRVDLPDDMVVTVPLQQASSFFEHIRRLLRAPFFAPPPLTPIADPSAIPPI